MEYAINNQETFNEELDFGYTEEELHLLGDFILAPVKLKHFKEFSREEENYLETLCTENIKKQNKYYQKVNKLISNKNFLNVWEQNFIFGMKKRFNKNLEYETSYLEKQKIDSIYNKLF